MMVIVVMMFVVVFNSNASLLTSPHPTVVVIVVKWLCYCCYDICYCGANHNSNVIFLTSPHPTIVTIVNSDGDSGKIITDASFPTSPHGVGHTRLLWLSSL